MATLSRELRKTLERVVLAARGEAEAGARKALAQLAVANHEPWATMAPDQLSLRRRLRARGRQLGDRLEDGGKQTIEHLASECAYEQWHRMLFARFLAECDLLIWPESGHPIGVDDCQGLARQQGVDWVQLASAFAQRMLPQIFRADDAVLEINLPAEHRQALERLLVSLPRELFLADDSLGWVYQFWQAQRKDDINESGTKIGADELPAVTQLFTEDYMVESLLHNTLGAWWAGKLGALPANTEEDARAKTALPVKDGLGITWTYLRFIHDEQERTWSPASGTFSNWPSHAQSIKFLDPCMGSGHFIVFALPMLARMRMEEENLSLSQAIYATLKDNLFGLELDDRCAQIAAFNLAFSAWKLGGYQTLPPLRLACSGFAPRAEEKEWVSLAGGDDRLKLGMARIHAVFREAPLLGSLIDPVALSGDLVEADFHELRPLLDAALAREAKDDVVKEIAVTARGIANAAEILAGQFTLIATNFPYLKRANQTEALKQFASRFDEQSHAELATTFLVKAFGDLEPGGTLAVVTPQSLTYQRYYVRLRKRLLDENRIRFVAKLGPRAFETISGEIVQPILLIVDAERPDPSHCVVYADFVREANAKEKARALREGRLHLRSQRTLLNSREFKINLADASDTPELAKYCDCYQGICTGDIPRFGACFWELPQEGNGWVLQHSTPENSSEASGCTQILFWEEGSGALYNQIVERLGEAGVSSWIRGLEAWGSKGVAIAQMQSLRAGRYTGKCFDNNTAVIIPKNASDEPAIFEYCRSEEYRDAVLEIDQSIKISNKTLLKVPFDVEHWREVAAEKYSRGFPSAFSSDPTQWLFDGRPNGSKHPLHVAVARLLGYRWPRQTGSTLVDCPPLDSDGLEDLAADDGIVCISPVKGDDAADQRLAAILQKAYGSEWSAGKLGGLLREEGSSSDNLETWLRDEFFAQHCELFHQRPFLWHIWDGRRDGFSALANYHKLTRANLERLTYAYLGDWIRRQQDATTVAEAGSDARLVAARRLQDELKKILDGEPPYDIFVRWKPVTSQPIGWEPDVNDGVRVNIRPFLMAADVGKKGAGLFRIRPNVKWEKDRGKEPSRSKDEFPWFWAWDGKGRDFGGGPTFDGNRWNDLHYTRDFKTDARRKKGLA